MEGRSVVAFIQNGLKFADCQLYTDVTANVQCKVNMLLLRFHSWKQSELAGEFSYLVLGSKNRVNVFRGEI